MNSDETYIKVNCIHRLKIICTVIGPDAIKSHLLPYLGCKLYLALIHEDEEVLFALAEALGDIYEFVQNSPGALLSLLEVLAGLDETVVRDQAVKTLNEISKTLSDFDITNLFIPILTKLSTAENFSSRVSACGLFAGAYPRSGGSKEKLRSKFLELSHEDTPMVRRAAVIEMGRFSKVLEKNYVVSDIIPDFRGLAQDEQDQVRTLCIDSLIEVAKLLNKEENKLHTLPIILVVGDDKSWKVRYHFALKFPAIAEALGRDITESSLIQTFVQLLRDNEADVKTTALSSLKSTIHFISRDRVQALVFPTIEAIVADNSLPPKVKKNCAEAIADLGSSLGKDFASSKLVPLVMSLIGDDNYEVKLKMIEGLGKLVSTIGSELMSPSLCNILMVLSKDSPQWRLRQTAIKCCVDVCKVLGDEIFTRSLQDVYFNFLTDPISEVRNSGIETLSDVISVLGDDWANAELLPKLQDIYHQRNFLIRITVLHALAKLNLSIDQLSTMIYFAAKDNVPNVRLVLCKVMKEISTRSDISSLKK
jgi:serine/threonine-protein phosphatase 2A regulatory subunit A